MSTQSRIDDTGKTLVLKAGDRRSTAAKRLRTIEKHIAGELRIDGMTETLRVLCVRVAELTLISEELSDRLVTGKRVDIELMGRNIDRLQRTMAELREQAKAVRFQEHQRHLLEALEDDDEEEGNSSFISSSKSRPRAHGVESVIVDPKGAQREAV